MATDLKPDKCSYCFQEPDLFTNPANGEVYIRCPWGSCYSVIADAGVTAPNLELALGQWHDKQQAIADEKATDLEMEQP